MNFIRFFNKIILKNDKNYDSQRAKKGIRDFSLNSDLWSIGPCWRTKGIKKMPYLVGAKNFAQNIKLRFANFDIFYMSKINNYTFKISIVIFKYYSILL